MAAVMRFQMVEELNKKTQCKKQQNRKECDSQKENQPMFVQVAEVLGIRGIHHTDYKPTCAQLTLVGL
jgi:hypothetical protein